MTSKVLIGIESICKHFNIGERGFNELRKKGMPVTQIAGKWVVHVDSAEEFVRQLTLKDSSRKKSVKP